MAERTGFESRNRKTRRWLDEEIARTLRYLVIVRRASETPARLRRSPGLPLLPLARLQRIVEGRRAWPWIVERGKSERDGWSVAYVGLGRDLSGATVDRLASDLGISATKARRLYAFHRAELDEQGAYAGVVVELARRGIEDLELASPGPDASPARGGVRR